MTQISLFEIREQNLSEWKKGGYQDFLIDYVITNSLGLSAKINGIVQGSSQGTSTRTGGPGSGRE